MSSDDKDEKTRMQSEAVRFKIIDERLEQISRKLDHIRILLVVIALPIIIGGIGVLAYLLWLGRLFSQI